MNRTLSCIAALTAFGVPAAHAGDDRMVDACVKEFVATHLASYQGNIVIQKPEGFRPLLLAGQTDYRIQVAAADTDGRNLASITCRVDLAGRVVGTKLDKNASRLAQRLAQPAKPVVLQEAG
jgi:hypothetical protein